MEAVEAMKVLMSRGPVSFGLLMRLTSSIVGFLA
jgi:hypothetical protein